METKLSKIINKYLGVGTENLKLELKNISKWDSLSHIQLVAEIEIAFNISFDFEEINTFKSLEDIFNSTKQKIL